MVGMGQSCRFARERDLEPRIYTKISKLLKDSLCYLLNCLFCQLSTFLLCYFDEDEISQKNFLLGILANPIPNMQVSGLMARLRSS